MRYTAETRLRPGQVYAQAREYFGTSGKVGLDLTEHSPNRLSFVGGGGFVMVTAHRAFNHCIVNLEVWQFDQEAQDFLASLPAPSGPVRRAWERWRAARR